MNCKATGDPQGQKRAVGLRLCYNLGRDTDCQRPRHFVENRLRVEPEDQTADLPTVGLDGLDGSSPYQSDGPALARGDGERQKTAVLLTKRLDLYRNADTNRALLLFDGCFLVHEELNAADGKRERGHVLDHADQFDLGGGWGKRILIGRRDPHPRGVKGPIRQLSGLDFDEGTNRGNRIRRFEDGVGIHQDHPRSDQPDIVVDVVENIGKFEGASVLGERAET